MRNLLIISSIALLVSCTAKESGQQQPEPVERAIGFATALPDHKWHLGTEAAIQIVADLDKAWSARDYEKMKGFFADTAVCYFHDGRVAKSSAEFVDLVKSELEGSDDTWTFDYAFSVDLDPSRGGEHVQAGFTGTGTVDGEKKTTHYHESYYIIDGKIVMWTQLTRDVAEE